MATFTVPERSCPANAETNSPGVVIGNNLQGIRVTLTSSQWAALAGSGRVLWGIALSFDGGATWGPAACDNTSSNTIGGASLSVPAYLYETDDIGATTRSGSLPSIAVSGGQLTQMIGAQARLFAWPTTTIPLGATITTTP